MKRLLILLTVFLLSLNLFSQDVLVKSILDELNRVRNKHNSPSVILMTDFNKRGNNHNDNLYTFKQEYLQKDSNNENRFIFNQSDLHREYNPTGNIEIYETVELRYDGKIGREVVQVYPCLFNLTSDALADTLINNFYISKDGHRADILSKQNTKVMISINVYKYNQNIKFPDGKIFPVTFSEYYLTMYLYK